MTATPTGWKAGDPGPSGFGKTDGSWPCQCHTCSACPEPTPFDAAAVRTTNRSVLEQVLCTECLRRAHARAPQKVTKWEPTVRVNTSTTRLNPDQEQRLEQIARDETARMLTEVEAAYWRGRIPERFVNASLRDWDRPQGVDTNDVDTFISNVGQRRSSGINLVLVGGLGVGKTWLLHAIANHIVQRIMSPRLVRIGKEADILVPLMQGSGLERQRRVADLLNPVRTRALIVDEVGRASYYSDAEQRHAWDLLTDYAYARDVPLVIATNLAPRVAGHVGTKLAAAPSDSRDWKTGPAAPAALSDDAGAPAQVPEAQGGHLFLGEYLGDAAYDRILSNTPSGLLTPIVGQNRRALVRDGRLTR